MIGSQISDCVNVFCVKKCDYELSTILQRLHEVYVSIYAYTVEKKLEFHVFSPNIKAPNYTVAVS